MKRSTRDRLYERLARRSRAGAVVKRAKRGAKAPNGSDCLWFVLSLLSWPPFSSYIHGRDEICGHRFRQRLAPDKKYIVESMNGGVAFFDFDNDGLLDIYLVNS
jgi:hypothetical protein